jgi:hypothetical protein
VNGILIVNTICEYNIKHFSFCIVNSIPLAFLIGGQPMHQQKKQSEITLTPTLGLVPSIVQYSLIS